MTKEHWKWLPSDAMLQPTHLTNNEVTVPWHSLTHNPLKISSQNLFKIGFAIQSPLSERSKIWELQWLVAQTLICTLWFDVEQEKRVSFVVEHIGVQKSCDSEISSVVSLCQDVASEVAVSSFLVLAGFLLLDDNRLRGDLTVMCSIESLDVLYVDCDEILCPEGCCKCCTDGVKCHDYDQ